MRSQGLRIPFASPGAERRGEVLYCAHVGGSMNPILNAGDLLEVEPYCKQRVQVGDVIFFLPPRGDQHVVHRVVTATHEGIHTRGDNCSRNDPWLLQAEDVVGRVAAAWRGKKRRTIFGGLAGRLVGCLARWRHVLDRKISALFRPLYHSLSRRGRLRSLLPTPLRPRLVIFQTNHRFHKKVLMGSHEVGCYEMDQGRWHIKRPFRLFVDESRLSE